MSNVKPSTLWTIGILVGWLVLVALSQSGILDEQGGSNGNKYGLVIGFLYGGPILALVNWIYMRRQEKREEEEE